MGVRSVSRTDRVPDRTSKAGNRYLRRLLNLGASCRRHTSGVRARISARRGRKPDGDWLSRMLQRKGVKIVALPKRARTRGAALRHPLANRMARVVRALTRSGESYRANPA